MSGKYILRTAEDGYLTQKNISFAFLRCIGVSVDEFTVVKKISILQFVFACHTHAHASNDVGAGERLLFVRKRIRLWRGCAGTDSRGTSEYLERV